MAERRALLRGRGRVADEVAVAWMGLGGSHGQMGGGSSQIREGDEDGHGWRSGRGWMLGDERLHGRREATGGTAAVGRGAGGGDLHDRREGMGVGLPEKTAEKRWMTEPGKETRESVRRWGGFRVGLREAEKREGKRGGGFTVDLGVVGDGEVEWRPAVRRRLVTEEEEEGLGVGRLTVERRLAGGVVGLVGGRLEGSSSEEKRMGARPCGGGGAFGGGHGFVR